MRKRGKYEALPANAPKNKTKDALLKAYIMSLLSLLLSCTMFMGTTAAWFTAEVTNTGNQIQVGVLSVDLLHGVAEEEQTKWISLKTETDHKVFDGTDPIWKPGSTDVQVLKVVNDGDILLGYQVTLLADLPASTDRDGNGLTQSHLQSLGECFQVYCAAGENRTFDADTWQRMGTLTEVMEGKPLYAGSLAEDGETVFSVAVVMNEDADNVYMGHKLEMYLKLTAYQGGEGFVPVSGEATLREALLTGGDILLLDDITFDEPMQVAADSVILLNGKNLTFAHSEQEARYAFEVNNGVHLTLDAEGSVVNVQNGLVRVKENTAVNLVLLGGTYLTPGVTGPESGLIHIPNGAGVTLDVVMQDVTYDQEQSGWAVRFGDGEGGSMNLTLTNCTVSAGHGIRTAGAGTVEISGCSIHAVQGIALQVLTSDGATVTDSDLSAAYPGAELEAGSFIYTVTTAKGGTAIIDGGSVSAGVNMFALAVLEEGDNLTARNCTLDETATFVHDEAVGTVLLP